MSSLASRIPSGQILGGSWVQVKFVKPSNEDLISLAREVSYNEDFRVQPAEVIGFLGPIAYDSLGYQCQFTIGLLVPRPGAVDISGRKIGTVLQEYFPTRSQILDNGFMPEIDINFYDYKDTSDLLNEFRGAVLATNSMQVQPNQYAVRNATFFTVERSI